MNSKRKNNKIILAIMTLMGMFTFFSVTKGAMASNVDSQWSFNLSVSNGSYCYTDTRTKDTDSKMYFKWGTSVYNINAIYVTPFAVTTKGEKKNASTRGNTCINYYVSKKGQYRITNYVNEKGYNYAALGVKAASGTGTAKGAWSPDTWTTYHVLQVDD